MTELCRTKTVERLFRGTFSKCPNRRYRRAVPAPARLYKYTVYRSTERLVSVALSKTVLLELPRRELRHTSSA